MQKFWNNKKNICALIKEQTRIRTRGPLNPLSGAVPTELSSKGIWTDLTVSQIVMAKKIGPFSRFKTKFNSIHKPKNNTELSCYKYMFFQIPERQKHACSQLMKPSEVKQDPPPSIFFLLLPASTIKNWTFGDRHVFSSKLSICWFQIFSQNSVTLFIQCHRTEIYISIV